MANLPWTSEGVPFIGLQTGSHSAETNDVTDVTDVSLVSNASKWPARLQMAGEVATRQLLSP